MKRFHQAFTLIELMIVVAIIGILAAIAIPRFLRFQIRAKQSEVKANLRTIYVTEQAYHHESDSFTESLLALGYSPERGNRYSYVLSTPAVYWTRNTASIPAMTSAMNAIEVDTFKYASATAQPTPVVTPSVTHGPTGGFTIVAPGSSIDPFSPMDEWSISSRSRTSGSPSSDTTCAAGNNSSSEPCQDQGPL